MVTRADRLTGNISLVLRIECELHNRGVGVALLSLDGVLVDFWTPEGKATLKVLIKIVDWHCDAFRGRQSVERSRDCPDQAEIEPPNHPHPAQQAY